jgi:hypothetical protein
MKIKKLLWIFASILIGLPIISLGTCCLLLRSERFVQSYLLPKVSELAGMSITAQDAKISLLSEINLRGLQVRCNPKESSCYASAPLAVSASSLNLTYNIWGLFSKKLAISSISSDGLHISMAAEKNPGTLNKTPPVQDRAPLESTPKTTSKPGFHVTIENAALKNSSFRYIDAASEASYLVDETALDIPKADSNGDSELRLQTRVTAQGPNLSLREELLRGSITIRDAALFAPRSVLVSAKAGSLQPTPLELDGSLNFSETRDSLQAIQVTKAVVRNTLLKTLSIASVPFTEFEYELKVGYPLKQPAPIDFLVKVNKAIAPSSADLKGSQISSTLSLKKGSITLDNGALDLIANGSKFAKGSLSGELGFDPYTTPSNLNAQISEINFDTFEGLFAAPTTTQQGAPTATPTPEADKIGTTTPSASSKKETNTQTSTTSLKLPLVNASIAIDKAIYQKLGISNIRAELTTPNSRTIQRAALAATFDGAGALSASASGSLDSTVNFKANADKINVLPLAALAQGDGQLLEGTIDRLNLDLSLAPANPRSTITGRSELLVSRFIVPSTLHGQVPFNILFLPFDALITVFGGTLNAILPKSVSSISDGIREVLDDAGRLGIEKGTVDIDFNQGKITCKKVDIDTKNLPDFTVKGSVTANDKLDFTIFIGLLKLNLPLPVAGTLSMPLPDVVYLGPEIVRGLGLSIGNIAGGVVSMVGGGSKEAPPATPGAGK